MPDTPERPSVSARARNILQSNHAYVATRGYLMQVPDGLARAFGTPLMFGPALLTAAVWSLAQVGFLWAVVVTIALMWAWTGRGSAAGRFATVLVTAGVGLEGLALFCSKCAATASAEDVSAPRDFAVLAVAFALAGVLASVYACGIVAREHGRSRWWTLAGLGGVVGFVLMLLFTSPPPSVADLGPPPVI